MSSIPATSNGIPVSYDRIEATIEKAAIDASLSGTTYSPYWLGHPDRPAALPALEGNLATDLLVVGGGYSGLWTALLAKEQEPGREVALLEAETVGWAASGRNGGFCEASLVHGASNGEKHLPRENERLTELGTENLAGIISTIKKYNIDCDLTPSGVLNVATEKHQVPWLEEEAAGNPELVAMDAPEVRAHINSPLFEAGIWEKDSTVLVHPAKLAWGLRRVCLELGVMIFEHTRGEELTSTDTKVRVRTGAGHITARRVALATNAFPSLLKRHRLHTIPVYDYALMTAPLSAAQREPIGWKENMGLADMDNRFHYSRPTVDEDGGWRLLYGGYDAIYHSGRKTELTELGMVRKKPLPFPPEPAAWLGVRLMTSALVKADRNAGRRGPFLRSMDALGMGFDS